MQHGSVLVQDTYFVITQVTEMIFALEISRVARAHHEHKTDIFRSGLSPGLSKVEQTNNCTSHRRNCTNRTTLHSRADLRNRPFITHGNHSINNVIQKNCFQTSLLGNQLKKTGFLRDGKIHFWSAENGSTSLNRNSKRFRTTHAHSSLCKAMGIRFIFVPPV